MKFKVGDWVIVDPKWAKGNLCEEGWTSGPLQVSDKFLCSLNEWVDPERRGIFLNSKDMGDGIIATIDLQDGGFDNALILYKKRLPDIYSDEI